MPEIDSTATEIAVLNDRSPVIAGETPAEIIGHAREVASELKRLIDDRGLAIEMGVDKKTGKPREHVTVEGWQAMGALLGAFGGQPLHAETIFCRRMERDDDVIAYEAAVEIRTLAGDSVGVAESMATNDEERRRGAAEHAVRSMAETRAAVRAYRAAAGWLVSLAGYASTPAEEMPDAAAPAGPKWERPPWAAPGDVAAVADDLAALLVGAGKSADAALEVGQAIFDAADGEVPEVVAVAIRKLRDVIAGPPTSAPDGLAAAPVDDPAAAETASAESRT